MDRQSFKELLEREHVWPCEFTFKFIVSRAGLDAVLALLPGVTPTVRPSAKDNYVGVTFRAKMSASDQVLDIYERASLIDSLITL